MDRALFVVVQALNDAQPGTGKSRWRRMVFSCRRDGSEPHLALPWREWSRDGKTIALNAMIGGTRRVVLLDVSAFIFSRKEHKGHKIGQSTLPKGH